MESELCDRDNIDYESFQFDDIDMFDKPEEDNLDAILP